MQNNIGQNNIGAFLEKRAFLSPQREAFYDGRDTRLTFAELASRSNQVGQALLDSGVQAGDRVGLLLMNGAEFLETFFALARIGAVVVPLNWRLVADELTFILDDSGTTTLIHGEEFADTVADIEARRGATKVERWIEVGSGGASPFAMPYEAWRDAASTAAPAVGAQDDDLLYIMYTSGTTGLPKGVMHTHTTAMWGVLTIAATADLRLGDRYLLALPLFHVGALTPATLNVYRGVTSVVLRAFDPRQAWALIDGEKITTALAVPAMLNAMLQVPDREHFDHDSLRWCMSGAAPVPTSLIEAYAALGIEIHQVYGLTESCGPGCLIDPDSAMERIGSTGKAFFHTEVKIVDDEGRACPPNVAGQVLIRGPHVMTGYWKRPDATADSMQDGWLKTGDGAIMDEQGYVYIQDRIKDMIISGGENVYPAEIENVLMGHEGIREAAVIGQPSARWGESPCAVVVRSDAALDEAAVMRWCGEHLARFKLPRSVVFVDEIPRNPSGKILKRVLRDAYPGPAPE